MGDLIISGLTHLEDLAGLENLAHYGPELSIVDNTQLTTTSHLSANISVDSTHFLSLTNVGIRSNPLLRDLSGLRLISDITGEEEDPLLINLNDNKLSLSLLQVFSTFRMEMH